MPRKDQRLFEIELLSGPDDGEVIGVDTEEIILGRQRDCCLPLTSDTLVSRQHAQIRLADGRLSIEDLRSSFGTFVNGEKISQRRELEPTDVVCLGRTEFFCRLPRPDASKVEMTQHAEQTALN